MSVKTREGEWTTIQVYLKTPIIGESPEPVGKVTKDQISAQNTEMV